MLLKTELHCHNSFSNFHVGDEEPPYDCAVSIRDQLEQARILGLNTIFVTNHNTLDGYKQMLEYKNNHSKFNDINIYPAEEITTNDGAHVLAYGLHKEIPVGLSFNEVLEEIHKQSAISSAPHPFSLLDALRENAKKCDMIEVFNSNNVDVLSNVKAESFATENNMIKVSGSDSHVISTLGRCVNVIEAENSLDSILSSIHKNKISILQTGYAFQNETLEHLKYKINNSREFLSDYIQEYYPNSKWLLTFLLRVYDVNQNSYLWSLFYKLAIFLMRRISNKINFENTDPSFMKERNIATMFKMAL